MPSSSSPREVPWWERFVQNAVRPFTDWLTIGGAEAGWHQWDLSRDEEEARIEEILKNAQTDPTAAQGALAQGNLHVNPETEKWLDNLIAQQNTQQAQDFSIYQSQNDILNAANQLQQLGLSASGVLQTGGSQMNGVAAADNVKSNIAQQRYAQRMALAKQLLGMTSQMASAGIYGNAIGAAKKASAIITSAASHSALAVQNQLNDAAYKQLSSQPGWVEYY